MAFLYNFTSSLSPVLAFLRISYRTVYVAAVAKLTSFGLLTADGQNFDQIPLDTDLSIVSPALVIASTPALAVEFSLSLFKGMAHGFFWSIWNFIFRIPVLIIGGGTYCLEALQTFILMTPFGLFYVGSIAIFIVSLIVTKGALFRVIYVMASKAVSSFVGMFGFLAGQIFRTNKEFYLAIFGKIWAYLEDHAPYLTWALGVLWSTVVWVWNIFVGAFVLVRDVKNIMVYLFFGNKIFEDNEIPTTFFYRVQQTTTIFKGLRNGDLNEDQVLIFNRFREQLYLLSGEVNPLLYPELKGFNLNRQEMLDFISVPEGQKITSLFQKIYAVKEHLKGLSEDKAAYLAKNVQLDNILITTLGPGYLNSAVRTKATAYKCLVDGTLTSKNLAPFEEQVVGNNVTIALAIRRLQEYDEEINMSMGHIQENLERYCALVKKLDVLPEELKRFELERHENSYQFWLQLQNRATVLKSELDSKPRGLIDEVQHVYHESLALRNELIGANRCLIYANDNLDESTTLLEKAMALDSQAAKTSSVNEIFSHLSSPFDVYVLYNHNKEDSILNQLIVEKKVTLGHSFSSSGEWIPTLFKKDVIFPSGFATPGSFASTNVRVNELFVGKPSKFVEIDESAHWVCPTSVPAVLEYVAALPFLKFALPFVKNL